MESRKAIENVMRCGLHLLDKKQYYKPHSQTRKFCLTITTSILVNAYLIRCRKYGILPQFNDE